MKIENELLNFCRNVRQLRVSSGLSKAQMARLLGISPKTLTSLEQGIFPPRMSCKVLGNILLYFHVPACKMFIPWST